MDFISQLIEENMERAIAINKVLVKNEEQLQHIEKEQDSMSKQNNYISQILGSWTGFLNRIWTYSGKTKHKNTSISYQNELYNANMLVDFDKNPEIVNDENILLDKIEPLKEITKSISQNLDRQNDILNEIKTKNNKLEDKILENQTKIKYILDLT